MKKTIITTIALAFTLIFNACKTMVESRTVQTNAQTFSIQQLISEDADLRNKILQMGYTQEHAQHDDSCMLGMLPSVFGPNGAMIFEEYANKFGRVHFYLNSMDKMQDISQYYQNNIKDFKFDSLATRISADNLGDTHEHYFFYLNGKKIRHIQLTFLEGKELKVWDDDTKVAERAAKRAK
jgi:hypothetical protein